MRQALTCRKTGEGEWAVDDGSDRVAVITSFTSGGKAYYCPTYPGLTGSDRCHESMYAALRAVSRETGRPVILQKG